MTAFATPQSRVGVLLAKLERVHQTAPLQWTARCPAHDDRNPSLSVGESEDGAPLVRCHAGCSPADVLAAVGVTWGDLYAERPDRPPQAAQAASAPPNARPFPSLTHLRHPELGVPTCAYPLYHPQGALFGLHCRFDLGNGEKTFRWWREGRWGLKRFGLSSSDAPLDGVSDLLTAPRTWPVVVVEGEKAREAAARAIRAAGGKLLAVASVTGASGAPSDASLRSLLGRQVLLWPDADAPELPHFPKGKGVAHMERIAARLRELGADQPRWIAWPDAPAKGDAFDYFAGGGTVDRLLSLVADAPLPARLPSTELAEQAESATIHGIPDDDTNGDAMDNDDDDAYRPHYSILSAREIEAITPAKGIIGNVLYEDSIAYLYGDSDTWKSFLALSWAASIAAGGSWLSRDVEQGPAIYIAAEGARGIGKRVTAWKRRHGLDRDELEDLEVFFVPESVNLLSDGAVDAFIDDLRHHPALRERSPRLIVFDTLARSMDGGDENGAKEGNKVTATASRIKAAFGCCVLIIHHSGKDANRGMRGSSSLRNNADTVIQVKGVAVAEGERRKPGDPVTVHCEKVKDSEPFDDFSVTTVEEMWGTEDGETRSSLVIIAHDGKSGATAAPVALIASRAKALDALDTLLTQHTEGPKATEWMLATGLAKRTFYDALTDLLTRRLISKDEVTGRYTRAQASGATGAPAPDSHRTALPDEGVTAPSTQCETPSPAAHPQQDTADGVAPDNQRGDGAQKAEDNDGAAVRNPIYSRTAAPPDEPDENRWGTVDEDGGDA